MAESTAESRLVIEAEIRIKAHDMADNRKILGQHAVRQREQGVDGISRRAAIALREVERELRTNGRSRDAAITGAAVTSVTRIAGRVVGLNHAAEVLEIQPCRVALNAQ